MTEAPRYTPDEQAIVEVQVKALDRAGYTAVGIHLLLPEVPVWLIERILEKAKERAEAKG